MDDKITLTLNSPITEEQWDDITDVDFEHTDRVWFTTKHGNRFEFVKASAQPEKGKCKKCRYVYYDKEFGNYWCNRKPDSFMVEEDGYCKWGK